MGGNTDRAQRGLRRGGIIAFTLGLLLAGTAAASAALSSDFVDEAVITGLSQPTNLEFAPDGRLFVAEKSGVVKVFESVDDTSATVFADLSDNVHDFWDRGLLGLAVHPDFPSTPYVYVLYTYGVPLDGSTPVWGDGCPSPPGGTNDGCVVSGRLSRLQAAGNVMTGSEVVLIEDWCQQYPSHSIGDLVFGPDGALYAGAGDGASFNWVDYGQGGGDAGSPTPQNPCGDPPVAVGAEQEPPSAEGGALRSQDLRTPGDPVTLDGTIIRIDPISGDPLPDNPAFGASDQNEERIVAYGLRNPFRMTVDPSSGAIYAGDVGWNAWEEVNRVADPTSGVLNFGWPCYEGGNGTSNRQGGYDGANLDICEDLYDEGSATSSFFAYDHDLDITGSDECPPANPPQGTSSSISGLAVYPGGGYPGVYNGALFGSDYSRNCIWVIYRDGAGDLDPTTVEVFQPDAAGPTDLEIGPNGDLYYAHLNYANLNGGQVRRLRFVGDNAPPIAAISADVESGSAPLTVNFDGSGSTDPDLDPIVQYEWDLDGDGQYDGEHDATGPEVSRVFQEPGAYNVRLRVTDSRGESATDVMSIQASNEAPSATIQSPAGTLEWHVGEAITFSGVGTDPDEGTLADSALTWALVLHHCETDGSCHEHLIQTYDGSGGAFDAPNHPYPSWLELRLTVSDQFGVEDTASVELQPELVDLAFETDPAGLEVSFSGEKRAAPFFETAIVGSTVEIGVDYVQADWVFRDWSNGGGRLQSFPAPGVDTTYTATFHQSPHIQTTTEQVHEENQLIVVDIESSDNADAEGSGLVYSLSGGADRALFNINAATGVLTFVSAPDFETPEDAGQDNTYAVEVTVTDSGGLSASSVFDIEVIDVDEPPLAHAGSDRAVSLGDTVILDGSGSSDPDIGSTLEFQWTIFSAPPGNTATLVGSGTASPTLTPDQPGTYVVRLQVSDGTSTDTDSVLVQVSEVQSSSGGFTDTGGSQFAASIDWLAEKRITLGCNPPVNDRFCPDDFVTRAQMAAFFARAFGWSDVGAGDLFVDDDGLVLEREIDLMGTAGVTRGCNPPVNDRFCPGDFVTRGQMAAFFERAFN